MRLPHRDDLDIKEVEELSEIFQEMFPGMKMVFAGDLPNVPEHVLLAIEKINEKHAHSVAEGLCIDCGAKMPNYPKFDDEEEVLANATWQPYKGWRYYTERSTGELLGWQCPFCDEVEGDGPKISRFSDYED